MDLFNIVYYGLICGLLGAFAPKLGKRNVRFVIGIAIGVIAATLLPEVRSAIG